MINFSEILKVLDVLTLVEVVKTGDRIIFQGRLKNINVSEMSQYNIFRILPCRTNKETYLEIDVY